MRNGGLFMRLGILNPKPDPSGIWYIIPNGLPAGSPSCAASNSI